MKGKGKKPAKIGGRIKNDSNLIQEKVAIEYLEMTIADAVTEVIATSMLRTNHGVVEAASKDCQNLIGKDRAGLEAHIVRREESGLDISLRSLVGINYMRISYPRLDAQLVLEKKEVSVG